MSYVIRNLASRYVHGLMSADHVKKLEDISATIGGLATGTSLYFNTITANIITSSFLSASTGTFHVFSASWLSATRAHAFVFSSSYFSASSGGAANFSSTTLTVRDLIVINSNITGSVPDPLSGATGRFHNLSASYFEFISGNVFRLTGTSISSTIDLTTTRASATILTVRDLVAINTNITATAVIPSVLSGTDFLATTGTFIYANVIFLSASTGTLHVATASYITGTEFFARTGTFHLGSSHILTATHLTASTASAHVFSSSWMSSTNFSALAGNINRLTSTSISSTLDVKTLKITGSFLTASTGTFHVVTSSYITGTEFFARTGTFHLGSSHILTATHLTSSTGSFHVFSSSWMSSTNFSALVSNINRLTSTSISSTLDLQTLKITGSFLTASTGTLHVITASYVTGTEFFARTGTFHLNNSHISTATHLTSSTGSFFIISSSWASATNLTSLVGNINRLTATSISSTLDLQTLKITGSFLTASTGTLHLATASYITGTEFLARTGTFHLGSHHILTSSHLTASTGTIFIHSSNYSSATHLTVQNLVAINTNITGTASVPDPLSGNTGRFHNLSASYYEFISGNINRLTSTSISSTLELQTLKITGSFLTASTGTLHVVTASYITGTQFLTKYLTATMVDIPNLTASNIWLTNDFFCELGPPDCIVSFTNIEGLSYITIPRIKAQNITSSNTLYIEAGTIFGDGFLLEASDGILTINEIIVDDITSSLASRHHVLSASYYEFISGNINRLTSTSISSTLDLQTLKITGSFLTASTGTLHVATASYLSSTKLTVESLVAINTNITASVPSLLTASSMSSTLDLQTLKITGSFLTASTGTIFIGSSSWFSSTNLTSLNGRVNYLTSTSIYTTKLTSTNEDMDLLCGGDLTVRALNTGGPNGRINFSSSVSTTFNGKVSIERLHLTGVSEVSPVRGYITDTNFSCSASTTQYVPLLSQSIDAGEVWQVNSIIYPVLTGTGGVRFTIFAPTGSVIQGFIHGKTTTQNTDSRPRIGAINTEVATTLNGATLLQMPQEMYFTVRNGANAGDIKIGVRRVTATDFCHIVSGSYMIATKCTIGNTVGST